MRCSVLCCRSRLPRCCHYPASSAATTLPCSRPCRSLLCSCLCCLLPPTHKQIVECFKQMPELARVAVDPFLPERSKAAIMDSLLKDSGATEITKRLFSE